MIVKKYQARLEIIENQLKGLYTLTFSVQGKRFNYVPGQFLHLAIDNNYDGSGQWPESRCFSMQTSPCEDILQITFAVKGAFTQSMEQKLKVGTMVWLKLPYGELFEQGHNTDNTVFIAGGTGITPYLSLFTDPRFAHYKLPVLYAGFRSEGFHLYQAALDQARAINPSFTVCTVYEDQNGQLDINHIYMAQGNNPSYFISGPPVMIKSFKQQLIEKGVAPSHIFTDEWE